MSNVRDVTKSVPFNRSYWVVPGKFLAGCYPGSEDRQLALYEDIDAAALKTLYQKCRKLENRYKIVLTVLEGSSIRGQLKILKDYGMDMEVCTPLYFKTYSAWTEKIIKRGSLDWQND